jgi:hypothetical protein
MIPTIEEILVKLANGDMTIDDADHWIREHLSLAEDTGHLRDLFAGLAMQAFIEKYSHEGDVSRNAYNLADAMLKARNK